MRIVLRMVPPVCLAVVASALLFVPRGTTPNLVGQRPVVKTAPESGAREDAPIAASPQQQNIGAALYRVEAPDILVVEMIARDADDPLRAGDELSILVRDSLPVAPDDEPLDSFFRTIDGLYRVQADGTIDLSPEYGSISVGGQTIREAKAAIERHLRQKVRLALPSVAVSLASVDGKPIVTGEHLIRADGTIQLGRYGSLYVNGMTLDEVKTAIEEHLSQYFPDPMIAIDVGAYNSKVIYVLIESANGESVAEIPYIGNETVLSVMSQIDGLAETTADWKVSIERSDRSAAEAIEMPVDWRAMTEERPRRTDYALFPGDRIFIRADPLIGADRFIAKLTAPVKRLFGFTLQTESRGLAPRAREATGDQISADGPPRRPADSVFTIAPPADDGHNPPLARQIVAAIKAEQPYGGAIEIDVADGIVQLSGIVATAEQRDACERAAASVAGVLRVDNRLRVRAPAAALRPIPDACDPAP